MQNAMLPTLQMVTLLTLLSGCRDAAISSPPVAPTAPTVSVIDRMPAEANLIAGISLLQLRNTPLWARFGDRALALAPMPFKNFSESCGFDLMKIATTVTVATVNKRHIAELRTNLSRPTIDKCLATLSSEDLGLSGDLHSYQFEAMDQKLHVVWLNKTSFLVGNVSRELMTRVKNGEGSAMAQPQFATLVEEVDTNATLWAISTPQKQRSEALEFEPLEWFRLQIDLERGLQMRMAVRFNDEKFAADARKGWAMTPVSGSLLELLSQNKSITGEGRDAIASLSLSPPQLEELTEAVEEMWPAIEDLFQVTFPSDADSLSQLEGILKRHKEAISDSKGDCRKIVDAINTKDMDLVPFVEFIENMAPDALLALEQKYQNEDISKEAVDKCWGNELKEYSKRQRQLHQERNRVTAPQ